jgi:hypothetical protein
MYIKSQFINKCIKNKNIYIGILLLFVILAFSFTTKIQSVLAQPYEIIPEKVLLISTPNQPLSSTSSIEEIIGLLVSSHNKWTTVSINATTLWYIDKETQKVETTLFITQPNEVYMCLKQYHEDGSLMYDYCWITDGKVITEVDNIYKQYAINQFPEFGKSAENFNPTINSDNLYVVRHPMEMLIPSPLSEFVYPISLAQFGGTITKSTSPMETVANKSTIKVTWVTKANRSEYSIDIDTGMILKTIRYQSATSDTVTEMSIVNSIINDEVISIEYYDNNKYVIDPGYVLVKMESLLENINKEGK